MKHRISCSCFYLSCSILIVNHPCSVTNGECKPNIICLPLVKKRANVDFIVLQLLSLTK